MTRIEWCRWADKKYRELAAFSEEAAEEARSQAGLPEVWVAENLSVPKAFALALACQIRLQEIQQ